MSIELDPALQSAIEAAARSRGIDAATLARDVLRARFLTVRPPLVPRDDWERQVLSMGIDCGVALSDDALSRESIYD